MSNGVGGKEAAALIPPFANSILIKQWEGKSVFWIFLPINCCVAVKRIWL